MLSRSIIILLHVACIYIINDASSSILISNTIPHTLSGQDISAVEKDGLSTWNVHWSNWPLILGQGTWEWFCPDSFCPKQGWQQFQNLPTNLPHV